MAIMNLWMMWFIEVHRLVVGGPYSKNPQTCNLECSSLGPPWSKALMEATLDVMRCIAMQVPLVDFLMRFRLQEPL